LFGWANPTGPNAARSLIAGEFRKGLDVEIRIGCAAAALICMGKMQFLRNVVADGVWS
jgi:hypothetical protein